MLAPDDGITLLGALAPPDSYSLDVAVGATFTLDLTALVSIPTAFALHRTTDKQGSDQTPLSLLEALRSHARRITVFSDAAHILLPDTSRTSVFGFLEDAVIPVRAPRNGLFHPKLWLLRFVDVQGAYLHRLLVPSRNLTFDRSWDTMVRVDEDPGAFGAIAMPELTKMTRGLLELPTHSASAKTRRAKILELADTVSAARFVPPPGFSNIHLHTLGFGENKRGRVSTAQPGTTQAYPFPINARHTLVVSPFLGAHLLSELAQTSRELTVVGRPNELDRAYAGLAEQDRPRAFDLDSRLVDDPGEGALPELHAKIFVHDVPGDVSQVFVGSANATDAAFNRNCEVLLEMSGRTRDVGVESFLDESSASLRSLLIPHRWSEPLADDTDDASRVRAIQQKLAHMDITATVRHCDEGQYRVEYSSTNALPKLDGATIAARPITLQLWSDQIGDRLFVAATVPLPKLTRFLGVHVKLGKEEERFVIACNLVGAPHDREDQLLAYLISDPSRLVRYLLMLLAGDTQDRFDANTQSVFDAVDDAGTDLQALPLMEVMLRALVRAPERMQAARQLMDVVSSYPELADPSLLALWKSVVALIPKDKT